MAEKKESKKAPKKETGHDSGKKSALGGLHVSSTELLIAGGLLLVYFLFSSSRSSGANPASVTLSSNPGSVDLSAVEQAMSAYGQQLATYQSANVRGQRQTRRAVRGVGAQVQGVAKQVGGVQSSLTSDYSSLSGQVAGLTAQQQAVQAQQAQQQADYNQQATAPPSYPSYTVSGSPVVMPTIQRRQQMNTLTNQSSAQKLAMLQSRAPTSIPGMSSALVAYDKQSSRLGAIGGVTNTNVMVLGNQDSSREVNLLKSQQGISMGANKTASDVAFLQNEARRGNIGGITHTGVIVVNTGNFQQASRLLKSNNAVSIPGKSAAQVAYLQQQARLGKLKASQL